MTLTFAQMQTALQRYGFDTGDPLGIWLNAALHEIEGMFDWPFLEVGPINETLAPGQTIITLPADFLKPIYVYDVTNLAKVRYWELRKFRNTIQDLTDTGMVEVYTIYGLNKLVVWRTPISSVTLEITYQGTSPDLVNPTDVPTTTSGGSWPGMLHYPIVQRAASIALQAENEEDRAKTAQDQFVEAVNNCMKKYAERELDEMDAVQDSQGYLEDAPIRTFGSAW